MLMSYSTVFCGCAFVARLFTLCDFFTRLFTRYFYALRYSAISLRFAKVDVILSLFAVTRRLLYRVALTIFSDIWIMNTTGFGGAYSARNRFVVIKRTRNNPSDDDDENSVELNQSEDSYQYHQEAPESENSGAEETDEEDEEESDEEETDEDEEDEEEEDDDDEEEPDFWSLLIQETARKMHSERREGDLDDQNEAIHDASQLVTGKNLSMVMNHLKNRKRKIMEISEAANNDELIDLIEKKARKIEKQCEGANEDITKEAEDIAWRKYKFLVKKKIIDNIEQFPKSFLR